TVELGRKYRYRVQVRLNDPNHPRGDLLPPSLASLDEKVRTRVREIDAADAAKPKLADGQIQRTYWRDSPWSEPSPVAELPSPTRVFAVKAISPAPTPVQIKDKQMTV